MSLIQTYTGRDKILRTAGYVARLLSSSVRNDKTAEKLSTVSNRISNCRTVSRFFDDVLMWNITRYWSVEVCSVVMFVELYCNLFAPRESITEGFLALFTCNKNFSE